MPGSITHLIVQQRLKNALSISGPHFGLLTSDPNSKYTAFGSIGPDFLFFSMREYGSGLQDFMNIVMGSYDAMEPFIKFYDTNIKPIKDAVSNAVTTAGVQLDQIMFQGLIINTKNTFTLMNTALRTFVERIVIQKIEFFDAFAPKIQLGRPEAEWFWFDLLHYRHTGKFCSNMFWLAGNNRDLQRYCVGYASHIATDVVGHPFVNGVVGGPYRSQWHRHKVVENWIDAYARNHYPDSQSTVSSLPANAQGANNFPGEIAGSHYADLVSFPSRKLPKELAQMFAAALRETYTEKDLPTLLSAEDIDASYRLFLLWFDRATSIGIAKPRPMTPPPGGAASGLINNYISGLPQQPGSGGGPSGSPNIGNILSGLLSFADYLGNVLNYTLDFLVNNAAAIAALPVVEYLNTMNWLLDQVQSAAYQIYDKNRFILVLAGYLFPEKGDLSKIPWNKALLNSGYVQQSGGGSASTTAYPRKRLPRQKYSAPNEYWLKYPTTPLENPNTEAHCKPWFGNYPEVFIDGSGPPTTPSQDLLNCLAPSGPPAPQASTEAINLATMTNTAQLGDGIKFSAWLIDNCLDPNNPNHNPMPDFNLDGDRGYGWKTWRPTNPNIDSTPTIQIQDYNC